MIVRQLYKQAKAESYN